MAEIIEKSPKNNKKKPHRVHRDTRVDLTPMVDLGFLLLSFFVFTSALQSPKQLVMNEPDDTSVMHDKLCESCVITIIPGADNRVFYYKGNERSHVVHETSFQASGIRALLRNKKKETVARKLPGFFVILKPLAGSSFSALIKLHDECTIAGVTRYYVASPTASDEEMVEASRLSLQDDK